MITIQNEQTTVTIDVAQLKRDATLILKDLGYADFDIGILLATDKHIHELNRIYRNKDKPTDILSFPYHTDLKAGQRINPQNSDDKNLGDIIIAPAYVTADAPSWNHTFEQRMRILLIHGICHLLGYDHIEDDDYEVMKKEEERLLKIIEYDLENSNNNK